MRRDQALIAGWTAAAALAAISPVTPYVRAALAVPLLFAGLGHVWSAALLPPSAPAGSRHGLAAERAAVDVGLSLVLLVLGGLALAALRLPLERASWLALAAVLVAAGIFVTWLRDRRQGLENRPTRTTGHAIPALRPRWPRANARLLMVGLAVVVTAAAVATAVVGAKTAPTTHFTSLAFVPGSTSQGEIVVHNEEGATRTYLLVITGVSGAIQRVSLTLASGASWQREIALGAGTTADLYLQDSAGKAGPLYRSVELRSQ